jgi:hypothetical protein
MTRSWVAVLSLVAGIAACKFDRLPPVDETDAAITDASAADASVSDGARIDATSVDGPDAPTYAISGRLVGMWNGAALAVALDAPPAGPERLTVLSNGSFMFTTRLPTGRSFTVSIPADGQPFRHVCTVQNPNGVVQTSDVLDVVVSCVPQVSVSVSLTAPVDLTFDPGTTNYQFETADGVVTTRVVVTSAEAMSILVNGGQVLSGLASQRFSLDMPVVVRVVVGTLSQNFTFLFKRSGPEQTGPVYAKSSNSDASDQQGEIAASDNLLVVGAPLEDSAATGVNGSQVDEASQDSGAVYVYRRTGLAWTQEAYIKPMDNQAGAHFGASVAVDNEGGKALLAVGAPRYDGGSVDAGAVFVFRRAASGVWTEEQRLQPTTPVAGAEFGTSLALNNQFPGAALVVGAPRVGAGSAYVFRYVTPGWSQEQRLTAPNGEVNDLFGARVNGNSDVVVVGAPGEDSSSTGVSSSASTNNAMPDSGAAYVFRRVSSSWNLESYVKASNTDAGDAFGTGLSLYENTIVVGAPHESSDGTSQANDALPGAGAVYAFEYDLTAMSWSQTDYLKAAAPSGGSNFGHDVCVHRNVLLVGAPEIDGAQGQGGFIRYFVRGAVGGFATASPDLHGSNTEEQDRFGRSVSCSGEGLFVGAPLEDSNARGFNAGLTNNSAPDSGAVYGYY